ncbi:MFS transporter [Enterococcus faecalis]|nr:MFS transporter [Enterococcus faecalis]
MSTETKEREKFATFARFGSSLGANGTTLVFCPYRLLSLPILLLINILKALQVGSGSGVIAAVISGGTAIITALGTKEVDTAIRQQNEKPESKMCSKARCSKRSIDVACLAYIAYAIANVTTTAVLFYFFKYIFGQPTEFLDRWSSCCLTWFNSCPIIPNAYTRHSRRYVYLGGIAMMISSYFFFTIAGSSLQSLSSVDYCSTSLNN